MSLKKKHLAMERLNRSLKYLNFDANPRRYCRNKSSNASRNTDPRPKNRSRSDSRPARLAPRVPLPMSLPHNKRFNRFLPPNVSMFDNLDFFDPKNPDHKFINHSIPTPNPNIDYPYCDTLDPARSASRSSSLLELAGAAGVDKNILDYILPSEDEPDEPFPSTIHDLLEKERKNKILDYILPAEDEPDSPFPSTILDLWKKDKIRDYIFPAEDEPDEPFSNAIHDVCVKNAKKSINTPSKIVSKLGYIPHPEDEPDENPFEGSKLTQQPSYFQTRSPLRECQSALSEVLRSGDIYGASPKKISLRKKISKIFSKK